MITPIEALSLPGRRGPVTRRAVTPIVEKETVQVSDRQPEEFLETASLTNLYNVIDEEKPRLLDRWLDAVVASSGSAPAFLLITALVLLWALLGIRYGQQENWQVLISDVQAILCYVFDSLLMRQQLNSYDRGIRISAVLQSRAVSIRRMLRHVKRKAIGNPAPNLAEIDISNFSGSMLQESWLNRTIRLASVFLGHVATMIFFWIGICIWLAFGKYCDWSVRWQLYINSATSALMVLIFALLARIREQNKKQTSSYLKHVCELDGALEAQLRKMTGDEIPNEEITIYPCKVKPLQRAISYYADLVGTLVGIMLLLIVVAVWVAIGPALHFSSNWWLIIGTYAGVIGMHDGFVLHNIQSQLNNHQESAMADVVKDDSEALAVVGVSVAPPRAAEIPTDTLTCRLSNRLSRVCSHEYSVILGIAVIIGLLVAATALRWSTTGQLLCNIPPSIIETFIMMVLITSHELDDKRHNQELEGLTMRREKLMRWVDSVKVERMEASEKVAGGSEKHVLPMNYNCGMVLSEQDYDAITVVDKITTVGSQTDHLSNRDQEEA